MKLYYRGSGFAKFEGVDRECHLYLNETGGGILLKVIVNDPFASSLLLPEEMSEIKIELSNGIKVVLFEAFRSQGDENNISTGKTTFSYSAKYVISDFSDFENISNNFNCVIFECTGLLGWGGRAAYLIDKNYGVKNNLDNKISLIKDDDYEINYYVTGTMLPVHNSQLFLDSIELTQHSQIEIKFTTIRSLENYFELFDKIKYLIELNTIEKIAINSIKGYSNSEFMMLNNDDKIPRALKIYSPIINNKKFESNYYGMYQLRAFCLEDLIENNSLQTYFNSFEKIKPIIELYIEILYMKDISPVRLFLNVVQALETYHSRFKAYKIKQYKKELMKFVKIEPII
ncbi:ApeA N-terminal domain 1-containing protein [Streptococcus uberis]|uniref:ApeA N-terminal domain 1-containing protein n=1 Tax=Streptococcus uberis TaxID=1349 RepID=UPI0037AF6AD4